jgi:hypothetical protein
VRRVTIVGALVIATAIAACSNKGAPTEAVQPRTEEPVVVAALAIERLAPPMREGASIALGKVGGKRVAFIADEDTSSVRTIDLDAKTETGSVALGGRPGQLLVMKNGQLAVAVRDDDSVALLDAHANGTLTLGSKKPTASEPIALALSPDDATLYVASGWSHVLQGFRANDASLGDRTLDVEVDREPRAVAITADGKRAFVSHATSSNVEIVELGGGTLARSTNLGIPAPRRAPSHHWEQEGPKEQLLALVPADDVAATETRLAFDDCFECGGSGFTDTALLPKRFARQAYALAHVVIHGGEGDFETFLVPHTEVMTGNPMLVSSGYGRDVLEDGIDEPAERFTVSLLDAATGKRKILAQIQRNHGE